MKEGKYLVVKKKYGGNQGKWTFPAGFVNPNETADEAVVREVLEETGIETTVQRIIGLRTGVIAEEVSDNMIVFQLEATGGRLQAQEREIAEVCFMSKEELLNDQQTSLMVPIFMNEKEEMLYDQLNPGDVFRYTSYKLFDIR
ncbi:NUDIX hydrolase [Fictibacillus macauensis]